MQVSKNSIDVKGDYLFSLVQAKLSKNKRNVRANICVKFEPIIFIHNIKNKYL